MEGKFLLYGIFYKNEYIISNVNISIPGSTAQTLQRYVTSDSKNLQQEPTINASNDSLQVVLEPQSVTTLVSE